MSNFIIKPDGLFPSTYSQMGRVLIPSKKCNNRKIARKYDEKGSTSVLNTQTGIKTLSAPYISTFKQFDRPGPLISEECQPCRIVSVPSVTDKTVYPCSSGKYSVTGYVDASNKIGVLGNSMFPRITTSDYQLYQQYRDVTEKKNIVEDCCPFNLESGFYRGEIGEGQPFVIIYKDCKICTEPIDIFLSQGSATEIKDVKLQQINNCQYSLEFTEDGKFTTGEIDIIANNTFSLTLDSGTDNLTYQPPVAETFSTEATINSTLFSFSKECGEDIEVTDFVISNNVVTFKEDGQLKSFDKVNTLATGSYFLVDGDTLYFMGINGNAFQIQAKITCECFYFFQKPNSQASSIFQTLFKF